MKKYIVLPFALLSFALFVTMFTPKVSALSCNNCVTAADIVNGTIKSADIADSTVRAADLANDSVGSNEIKANAVGNSELIDGPTFTTVNSDVLNLAHYLHLNSESVTITDNGTVSAASITLVPSNLYITVNCLDPHGCTLLLDPSDEAEDGFIAIVINESASNTVTLPHAAGQYAIDGGSSRALGPGDTSTLISEMTYGLWVETAHTNTTIPS